MIDRRFLILRGAATTICCVWLGATAIVHGDDAPWEWRPYRVTFDYESTAETILPESFIAAVRETVESRLQEYFAAAWALPTEEERETPPSDKRFSVRLVYERGRYQVLVYEEDVALQSTGPTVIRTSPSREAVGELIFVAIVEAFRPTTRVDEARSGTATVRLRAAELYSAAARDRLLRRGMALMPIVRRLDRDGITLETQPIPWTLLVVDEPRGDTALCLVKSGLANPLGVRRRGRTERLAIAVGQPTGTTKVQITSRDGRPLAGGRVFVDRGSGPAELIGLTDAEGWTEVTGEPGKPVTIVVTSRFTPLAKLPLVPGLVSKLTATTAGEPELLAAEERLTTWQAKFLDGFLERRVLLALADAHVEREDRAAAEKLLAKLEAGAKLAQTRAELESLARRAATETSGGTQRAVAAMFAEAEAAVAALDDAAQIAELRRAVQKLKP